MAALRIPDFSKPQPSDDLKVGAKEFKRRTRDRLLENLTAGFHYQAGNVHMRDPADPQPPTRLHQLYKKEAVALEKIWHDDFFESEGLTVLYRESPAYLDDAMPLNIFTSMYWYVKLSRCGLVLNRNLPLDKVHATDAALKQIQLAQNNEHLRKDLAKAVPKLKENRFLTLGQARYHFARPDPSKWQEPLMEKVENCSSKGECC